MIKKIRYCDICGKQCDDITDMTKSVSLEKCPGYFHTETLGFTLSIDVCRECQKDLQETIDRLGRGTVMGGMIAVDTVEDCLRVFGAGHPFGDDQKLTEDGEKAVNFLLETLWYLKEQRVIDSFDRDRIDRMISETAY